MKEEKRKALINNKVFMIFYTCIMISFLFVMNGFPTISKDILVYEQVKAICFLLYGLAILFQVFIFPLLRKEKIECSVKSVVGMVFTALLGLLCMVIGIIDFSQCVKDRKQGIAYVTLKNIEIEYSSSGGQYIGYLLSEYKENCSAANRIGGWKHYFAAKGRTQN